MGHSRRRGGREIGRKLWGLRVRSRVFRVRLGGSVGGG